MSASATALYISASANRYNCVADITGDSLVAFGSSRLIALWDVGDPSERGVYQTLPGHQSAVTCVRFASRDRIFSADEQGNVLCWRNIDNKWCLRKSVKAHDKSISTLAIHGDIIVTGASDALVRIWRFGEGDCEDGLASLQNLAFESRYPLCAAIATLPSSEAVVLAVSGTDRAVKIWTKSESGFVFSATLQGHEDWVRSLAFREPSSPGEPLILASGSQDSTIRLWNIEPFVKDRTKLLEQETDPLSDELLDSFEASLGDLADAEEGGQQISLKRTIMTVKDSTGSTQRFSVTFDALLVGHEAGITTLAWRHSATESTPTLLSSSTDSSLILWSPSTIIATSSADGITSIWINRQRFGDIGGQRLGGFVGSLWAESGNATLAWGWSGGWRRWRCSSSASESQFEVWREAGAINGHHGPVKGIDWNPSGEFLISASLDQTTRIHGHVKSLSGIVDGSSTPSWQELSRPQVHGYDLFQASFIGSLKFVSIADEKVVRIFEAPRNFLEVANNLGAANIRIKDKQLAPSANVPPLGLSNKATNEDHAEAYASSFSTARRPFEGELSSMTFWPEIDKVFGHGYESAALDVSPSGKLAATACKATTADHAVIRVYDTDRWQSVGPPLEGHSLTVTRIAFSPDDAHILSVSRDRTWRIFEARGDEGFVPVAANKSHARIIWDCAWSKEGDFFITVSRDKTARVWQFPSRNAGSSWTATATIKLPAAGTAVAVAPRLREDGSRLLAIGLETGEILIFESDSPGLDDWNLKLALNSGIAHVDHVYRVSWRPGRKDGHAELASCSEDGTLRILVVK